jgi:PII-like signaling protein
MAANRAGEVDARVMGEADRWHDEPLYDAIVNKLRMMEIAGATVYRGILGYGAKGHQHKKTFFHPTRDVPVMISVIDTDEKIAAAAAAIEGMLQDGSDCRVRRGHGPAGSQP